MSVKPIKIPGPGHPITVEPAARRILVKLGDHIIADSTNALVLQEASYPAVYYIPRQDVDMAALERSSHSSHCPYKGDASYFSILEGGDRSRNAVWSYEDPHAAVSAIKDFLAFYPDRVDSIDALDEA
ncbi:DUF427 domain-containing protein [Neorhizobium lilium]|uniref:DUF427 domain-containing protein n=1 Tax=Neorhizobium lilium TaxID=2503024 RepID=A0A3S3VK93_9HYPH|nr:DUF427 domain-containing protein [Neorhizobium lilium]RWX78568.1 DUF427 domain-containing protein [Neorhizobium lilium]